MNSEPTVDNGTGLCQVKAARRLKLGEKREEEEGGGEARAMDTINTESPLFRMPLYAPKCKCFLLMALFFDKYVAYRTCSFLASKTFQSACKGLSVADGKRR